MTTTTGIIELNDAGLWYGQTRPWTEESPGVAVVEAQRLLLGNDALHQARLQPTRTLSRFWHRLSTEPLAIDHPQYRHHADLAFSHLLSLHQAQPACQEIIFALPGSFSREQISLLLGVTKHCPFQAVGLIDSAVAASLHHAQTPELLHIDLHLHHCIVSQLVLQDGELTRTDVELVPNTGLLAFYDRWAKTIADQFIDQTRFDPLHSANTEQSLYDQLPQWLAAFADQAELSLEVADKSIKLTRQLLTSAAQPLYQQIFNTNHRAPQILLSHRFASLPGLLANAPPNTQILPDNALAITLNQHWDQIRGDTEQLRYLLALPCNTIEPASASRKVTSDNTDQPAPTHLLVAGIAHALTGNRCYLQNQPYQPLTDRTAQAAGGYLQEENQQWFVIAQGQQDLQLNQNPVKDRQLLQVGDNLRWNNGQLQGQLIHVR